MVDGARLSKEERLLQEYNEYMRMMKERLGKKQQAYRSSLESQSENIKSVAEERKRRQEEIHEEKKRKHREHIDGVNLDHEIRRLQHIQIQADAEAGLAEDARVREILWNRTRDRDAEHLKHRNRTAEFKKKQRIAHLMELKRIEEFIANLEKEEEDKRRKNLDPELFEEKAIKMHGGPISFAFLDKNRDDVVTLQEFMDHGWPQKLFFSCDSDSNGFVNRDEFRAQSLNGPFVSFIQADSNLDDEISKSEWIGVGFSEMYFLSADTNDDSKLSKGEWIRWPYGNGYMFVADSDGDGLMSKVEWRDLGWSPDTFDEIDQNQNGKLDSHEFNIAAMEHE
jgi:hypothetical protein